MLGDEYFDLVAEEVEVEGVDVPLAAVEGGGGRGVAEVGGGVAQVEGVEAQVAGGEGGLRGRGGGGVAGAEDGALGLAQGEGAAVVVGGVECAVVVDVVQHGGDAEGEWIHRKRREGEGVVSVGCWMLNC